MEAILVVNAGSSSVKFQVFEIHDSKKLRRVVKGQVEGIGSKPRLRAENGDGAQIENKPWSADEVCDVATATRLAGSWLQQVQKFDLIAVGHRVVHGGPRYSKPVLVDREVLKHLAQYSILAPLHQPNNLAPINTLLERFPALPQVACFDTSFHSGHTAAADHYAIDEGLYTQGIRRYGFHGLSYEFVAKKLIEVTPKLASGRIIIAHLGSGASMCALSNGRSIESTMGFTSLDGLPMGTRPGQIDPGVLLYLMIRNGMSPEALQSWLYNNCGLKGLSGISNDVRELLASAEPRAALALDYFVYRVGLFAGMLAAALGGLDAFIFTAGIGERSDVMRSRIVEKLGWLGAELDWNANVRGDVCISTKGSRIALYVIPTDEELMVAGHTLALLSDARESKASMVRSA